ncbi:uncharacterized membrane-anchored protein YhcB (DUF1043 family) [Symbiobacterium terraclitae]|uniref:Uncharacterized membrane-anchored protein YhcB (DUF1043 family) n=1 Tax=Symbiobacterium terraclitae TaxID=557451 RepID=A0ABS4JUM2_9FIRM|nr:hypothetical protein [Symbiobacterium terraclitae]MBP2019241.1 uncharacterized membrane-anchored protein YhcB (DUF1043 family) [Symbiobacterium terraclitae]
MDRYFPGYLREHAARVWLRAGRVAYLYATTGALIGYLVGYLINPLLTQSLNREETIFLGLVGGVVGGFLGWQLGETRAEALRLQAQLALCQAQIEENTRVAQAAGADSPPRTCLGRRATLRGRP